MFKSVFRICFNPYIEALISPVTDSSHKLNCLAGYPDSSMMATAKVEETSNRIQNVFMEQTLSAADILSFVATSEASESVSWQ